MQATSQILSKLRNARFQPPNGAAKEKLAWINNGEADLLRSIGGSGKKRKFGLPSFSWRDTTGAKGSMDGSGGSMRAGGDVRGTGSGSGSSGSRDGMRGTTVTKTAAKAPTRVAPPVIAPPVYTLPPAVFTPPPPVFVAPPPMPRMKPAVPTYAPPPVPRMKPAAPKITLAPDTIRTDRMPSVAPAVTAPMARSPMVRSPAPMTRAAEIRTDRMAPATRVSEAPRTDRAPSGSFAPTSYHAPMARTDRMPSAPHTPEVRTDRAPTGGFMPSSYHAPMARTDRAPMAPGAGVRAVPEGPRTDRMDRTTESITSMAAEAAARAAANRSRVPTDTIPTPRANPLRDTSKIRTDATFDATTDFGLIEGATLSRLAALAEKFGKPITVTEGAAPFGTHVAKSAHHIDPRTGKASALDLKVATADRARLASLAHDVGYGGIGAYGDNLPGMVHVDGGKVRSWGPGGKTAAIGKLRDKALRAALSDRSRPRSVTSYAGLDDY